MEQIAPYNLFRLCRNPRGMTVTKYIFAFKFFFSINYLEDSPGKPQNQKLSRQLYFLKGLFVFLFVCFNYLSSTVV